MHIGLDRGPIFLRVLRLFPDLRVLEKFFLTRSDKFKA